MFDADAISCQILKKLNLMSSSDPSNMLSTYDFDEFETQTKIKKIDYLDGPYLNKYITILQYKEL